VWTDESEYIIRCGCGSLENPAYFSFDISSCKGFERKFLDIHLTIGDRGFWHRIKNALLYIFKRQKIWNDGDINLDLNDPKQRGEVEGLVQYLQGILDK